MCSCECVKLKKKEKHLQQSLRSNTLLSENHVEIIFAL